MSLDDERERRDYAKYDSMSTEALDEILRQVPIYPEDGGFDPDEIYYISRIAAERDKSAADCGRAEASWADFERKYLSPENSAPRGAPAAKKRPRRVLNAALIAAAVCVLLVGSAYAAEILNWIPRWNNDLFGFSKPEEPVQAADDHDPNARFESLEEALAAYDAPPDMIPSYIPDGYKLDGFDYMVDAANNISFTSAYVKGDAYIMWNYILYAEEAPVLYAKDEGDPEVYRVHGVDHYIMTNADKYLAVWQRENFECSISGYESRDELIRSIESIYAEE